MIINHNISAMNAHRMLVDNAWDTTKVLEKLSSGIRINRGSDDAAGLSVSEKMRAQVRGLNVAYRNAQDAVSLVQTAEGYLQEMTAAMQRMRELSVQAANGIYTDEDRSYIQQETQQLVNEVERIATQAEFNKLPLFLGNFSGATTPAAAAAGTEGASGGQPATYPETNGIPIHIGPNTDQRIFFTLNNLTTGALEIGESIQPSTALPEERNVQSKLNLTTAEGANMAIATLDSALQKVNAERTRLGAYQNRVEPPCVVSA